MYKFLYLFNLKIVLLYIAPCGKRINIVWLKWFKLSIFKKILFYHIKMRKYLARNISYQNWILLKKKKKLFPLVVIFFLDKHQRQQY